MKRIQMNALMKTVWCIVLALAMVLSTVCAFAYGDNEEPEIRSAQANPKENIMDFIILLDCSYSGGTNDPDALYMDACKNFIDKLPVQDVRVGVVSFGYQDTEERLENDEAQVHELIPLGPLNRDDASRKNFKKTLQEAVERGQEPAKNGRNKPARTPIGHALERGVKMLEEGGARENDAVILLISDCYNEPESNRKDENKMKTAMEIAKDNKWPICSIQLNYGNNDPGQIKAANELAARLSENNYLRGRYDQIARYYPCGKDYEVHIAFVKMFYYAYGIEGEEPKYIDKLPYIYNFEVPILVSETGLEVFGNNVTGVKIEHFNADGETDFVRHIGELDSNIKETNFVAVVERGHYFSVKLICPLEGKWKATIEGEGDAIAYASHSSLQEMQLYMDVSANGKPLNNLARQDVALIRAFFVYNEDNQILHSRYYTEVNPSGAALHVSRAGEDNEYKDFKMSPDKEHGGYFCKIELRDLQEVQSDLVLKVTVTDSQFTNGKKTSNTKTLYIDPKPIELIQHGPLSFSSHIDKDFEEINLAQIIYNPDGDPVTYTLRCENKNVSFDYEVDNNYLLIKAGPGAGTYQMTLTAEDPDVELTYDQLTLTVIDDAPESTQPLDDVWLWTDKHWFQKYSLEPKTLDLNEYFRDPEEHNLTYSVEIPEDAQDGVVQWNKDGSVVTISAVKKGSTQIRVSASDDANTVNALFTVQVESGKAYFWAHYWLPIVLSGVAIAVLLLVLIILECNRAIKGVWSFTIELDGIPEELQEVDIKSVIKKKRNIALRDLFLQVSNVMPEASQSLGDEISRFFIEAGANKINVKGVTRKAGCKVTGVPRGNNKIRATRPYNIRVHNQFAIELDDSTDRTLRLEMVLNRAK